MTYPIIKIPLLISSVTSNIGNRQSIDRGLPKQVVSAESLKYPRAIDTFNLVGVLLLITSAAVFIVATFVSLHLLSWSCVSFLLGFASINLADLLTLQKSNFTRVSTATTHFSNLDRSIQIISPNWKTILKGKVLEYGDIAQAQIGVSEPHFKQYLQKYFGVYLHPGYKFKLNDKFNYSSDFTLILPQGISSIVEIDEPYDGRTKKPHHCSDQSKDERRDNFFLEHNWIVIRFSEFQVCAYPDECCYTIAKEIDFIDSRYNFTNLFEGVGSLPLDSRWNQQQATLMAQRDYRLEYLKKYGIYHRD